MYLPIYTFMHHKSEGKNNNIKLLYYISYFTKIIRKTHQKLIAHDNCSTANRCLFLVRYHPS